MFNRHKNQNRSFFWGMVAGMLGGIWIANKMMHKSNQNQNQESRIQQQKHDQYELQNLNHLESKQKGELFDTFLHGSEKELAQKAKELQS
ncbi:hypothetical protein [Tepidibacillus sp. LV47]|uniref:hypothetical protein n=1 Tax=Tepidibacillus sp. LV47 TaxID=3398228 RepID=UPI003AB05878